ncbi:MAG: tyrosine-type recombinase/integrase [Aquabacterium sp.]|nr:tyrosine-type recombinase/integrase [Aquabacterium sp.]
MLKRTATGLARGPFDRSPQTAVANARSVGGAGPATLVADAPVPGLFAQTPQAAQRTWTFFTVQLRNPHTRKAYARAAADFSAWCLARGLHGVQQVQPVHVAAYVEGLALAAPTVLQRLAGLRMLFDWLVLGQVLQHNPAHAVRGPRHVVRQGQTPVLAAEEARALLDAIDVGTTIGLRDRALIGLMLCTFARVGAAVQMRVEDVYVQQRRTWVRLHEKGGQLHRMPCHPELQTWLRAYIQGAGLDAPGQAKTWLFRSAVGRTGRLSTTPLRADDVLRMVQRRALAAGIQTPIGCHSFRATGITEYLRNGGRLEVAQQMANHGSARTTGLYDRRRSAIALDDVARVLL